MWGERPMSTQSESPLLLHLYNHFIFMRVTKALRPFLLLFPKQTSIGGGEKGSRESRFPIQSYSARVEFNVPHASCNHIPTPEHRNHRIHTHCTEQIHPRPSLCLHMHAMGLVGSQNQCQSPPELMPWPVFCCSTGSACCVFLG